MNPAYFSTIQFHFNSVRMSVARRKNSFNFAVSQNPRTLILFLYNLHHCTYRYLGSGRNIIWQYLALRETLNLCFIKYTSFMRVIAPTFDIWQEMKRSKKEPKFVTLDPWLILKVSCWWSYHNMSNTCRDDYVILTIRHVKTQGPLPALLCVVCESKYHLSSVRCICFGAGTRGRARGKRKPTIHDPAKIRRDCSKIWCQIIIISILMKYICSCNYSCYNILKN